MQVVFCKINHRTKGRGVFSLRLQFHFYRSRPPGMHQPGIHDPVFFSEPILLICFKYCQPEFIYLRLKKVLTFRNQKQIMKTNFSFAQQLLIKFYRVVIMTTRLKILVLFILFVPSLALAARPPDTQWSAVAIDIYEELSEAQALYNAGDPAAARTKISNAYFDLFEGSGMETSISLNISEGRTYDLEARFGSLRQAVSRKVPPSELAAIVDALAADLKTDAALLDDLSKRRKDRANPVSLLFDAFIIILREGFEAILIIGALVAYLVKTGHSDKVNRIYLGALIALAASVLTAIILNSVISLSGATREAMEGITMLLATAVLFYVSYWLISKAQATRWNSFIKYKVEASLTGKSLFTLTSAAFLAVYREGAETILFYQALISSAGAEGKTTILYGFLAGSLLLCVLFFALRTTSMRVPLGPFFTVTGALLYYLAFSFAGKGVLELQEAEWISASPVGFPTVHFLGIYPSLEGLLLQGFLLCVAIAAGLYTLYISCKARKTLIGNMSHNNG